MCTHMHGHTQAYKQKSLHRKELITFMEKNCIFNELERADKWFSCGENRSWVHRHTSQRQMLVGNLSWVKTGRHFGDATGNNEHYP